MYKAKQLTGTSFLSMRCKTVVLLALLPFGCLEMISMTYGWYSLLLVGGGRDDILGWTP